MRRINPTPSCTPAVNQTISLDNKPGAIEEINDFDNDLEQLFDYCLRNNLDQELTGEDIIYLSCFLHIAKSINPSNPLKLTQHLVDGFCSSYGLYLLDTVYFSTIHRASEDDILNKEKERSGITKFQIEVTKQHLLQCGWL